MNAPACPLHCLVPVLALYAAALVAPTAARAQSDYALRAWGTEVLDRIQAEFWLPERGIYADKQRLSGPKSASPAFMWGCGVQLSALAAGARLDRDKYLPILRRYLDGLRVYWTDHGGIEGFDVLPAPKPSDRYYDDNAWMVLGLLDSYDLMRDPATLAWARKTYRFVMSGEDPTLGGGIYWRERDRKSKNTCVNGPATVAACRMYQATLDKSYIADARRLYAWTNAHLQDADGLYWDNVAADGRVERTKWSYNSALMLRANVLFYRQSGETRFRKEAERIAAAAAAKWIDPDTGAVRDTGKFAHMLCEAWLELYAIDRDTHWPRIVQRALDFVHTHVRDANGHYADPWGTPVYEPLQTYALIDQASAARAFCVAAQVRW